MAYGALTPHTKRPEGHETMIRVNGKLVLTCVWEGMPVNGMDDVNRAKNPNQCQTFGTEKKANVDNHQLLPLIRKSRLTHDRIAAALGMKSNTLRGHLYNGRPFTVQELNNLYKLIGVKHCERLKEQEPTKEEE